MWANTHSGMCGTTGMWGLKGPSWICYKNTVTDSCYVQLHPSSFHCYETWLRTRWITKLRDSNGRCRQRAGREALPTQETKPRPWSPRWSWAPNSLSESSNQPRRLQLNSRCKHWLDVASSIQVSIMPLAFERNHVEGPPQQHFSFVPPQIWPGSTRQTLGSPTHFKWHKCGGECW